MSLLVVLAVLLALAVTVPFAGADTRWPGSGRHPDRPLRGKRYQEMWDGAIAERVLQSDFGRTS